MLPEILEDALKIGFTRDRALIERMLGLIRSRLVPVPYGWGLTPRMDGVRPLFSLELPRKGTPGRDILNYGRQGGSQIWCGS